MTTGTTKLMSDIKEPLCLSCQQLRKDLKEAQEKIADYRDYFDRAYKSMPTDEVHCTCVPMLLKRAEAAEAKLKIAREGLEEIKYKTHTDNTYCRAIKIARETLKQLDAPTKLQPGESDKRD